MKPASQHAQTHDVLNSDLEVRDAYFSTLAALYRLHEAWDRQRELADPTGDERLIELLDATRRQLDHAQRRVDGIAVDLDDAATSLGTPYTAHQRYLSAVRVHADFLDACARGSEDEALFEALARRLDTLPNFHPDDSEAAYQVFRELQSEARRAVKLRQGSREAAPNEPSDHAPQKARQLLFGKAEILDWLKRPTEDIGRILRLNEKYDGPIISSQGASPTVDASELIAWWNGLAKRMHEESQKDIDTKETVAAAYSYGREATVLPDISGSVKRRRTRKPPQ